MQRNNIFSVWKIWGEEKVLKKRFVSLQQVYNNKTQINLAEAFYPFSDDDFCWWHTMQRKNIFSVWKRWKKLAAKNGKRKTNGFCIFATAPSDQSSPLQGLLVLAWAYLQNCILLSFWEIHKYQNNILQNCILLSFFERHKFRNILSAKLLSQLFGKTQLLKQHNIKFFSFCIQIQTIFGDWLIGPILQ